LHGCRTRAIVWLHDVEGLSHEEIAAQFGRSIGFSKSRLARAHALLREQLADRPAEIALSAEEVAAPRVLP
jgi:DNA-directed RNA polymerase specialized sigma24 family protein